MLKSPIIRTVAVTVLATAGSSSVASAQDKYTVKVPGGLAFSEFRGYEGWELISTSDNGTVAAIPPGGPNYCQTQP